MHIWSKRDKVCSKGLRSVSLGVGVYIGWKVNCL